MKVRLLVLACMLLACFAWAPEAKAMKLSSVQKPVKFCIRKVVEGTLETLWAGAMCEVALWDYVLEPTIKVVSYPVRVVVRWSYTEE